MSPLSGFHVSLQPYGVEHPLIYFMSGAEVNPESWTQLKGS